MKVSIIIICTSVALLLAQDLSPINSRFGQEIVISTPVDGDVYLAASKVTIDAPIRGDLVVAGGTVTINDSITQDILVAGGEVIVNGHVGDDIRAATGTITLSGQVEGDVVSGTGELILKQGGIINGNLTTRGGILDIFGYVKGDIDATGDKLRFSGTVDGELNARTREMELAGTVGGFAAISANTIKVLEGATFKKDIRYWNADGSLTLAGEGVRVTYDPSIKVDHPKWQLLGYSSVLMLLWYLGTALIVIWMIEYLFSKTLLNAAGIALQRSLGSMGYGVIFYIGVPVLCLGLMFTVLAIPIAVILMIAYGIVLVSATAVTAIIISNWLNRVYYQSSWGVAKITLAAFGIFILLKFFTLTPVIGPIIMVALACMAMGAITISVWNARKGAVLPSTK